MKAITFLTVMIFASALAALADVRYVDVNSTNPTAPYSSWATAALKIQDAVDGAIAGDEVVVTNGVYDAGGRAVDGALTNRVALQQAITLRSVNGPDFTWIVGRQAPGTTNGDGAVRCVYLTSGANLSGFTLTNGATGTDSDSLAHELSAGGGLWCNSASSRVLNCVIVGNSAFFGGGGAYGGRLENCTLRGNSVGGDFNWGGGAFQSRLESCVITGNLAPLGGGVADCRLADCLLQGNSARYSGGGAQGGYLVRCVLDHNTAGYSGGGAIDSQLRSCALTGNSASIGGGVSSWDVVNCTITGNTAWESGGGVSGPCTNCIIYFNNAPRDPNYTTSSFGTGLDHCCTTPLPNGEGNIDADPQLASFTHLSAASPCRAAGSSAVFKVDVADLDGESWTQPPAIGCDEYRPGAVTGLLSAGISATSTKVAVGVAVDFTARIDGQLSSSVWEFDDMPGMTNQPYISRVWTAPGVHEVILRAFSESFPSGIGATAVVQVVQAPTLFVDARSTNPSAPYASWSTAARKIQDAVDAATVLGSRVLVTNGVYEAGERVSGNATNRVVVDKPLIIQSVNGPEWTVIDGGRSAGCVRLAGNATLAGFTLTNGWAIGVRCDSVSSLVSNCVIVGSTGQGAFGGTLRNCWIQQNGSGLAQQNGSGVAEAVLDHCVISGNHAKGVNGGGTFHCSLRDCTITENSVEPNIYANGFGWTVDGGFGGGACNCTLERCVVSGNSAMNGGGASDCTLVNSILRDNSVRGGYPGGGFRDPSDFGGDGSAASGSSLNNCAVYGNQGGSAVSYSMLTNCTVTGNLGGGVSSSTLNNCIVYFNRGSAQPNYDEQCTLNYCCTTPLPAAGLGNSTSDPQLASPTHLAPGSPCRAAGNSSFVTGLDIDDEPWSSPPSIGCDEPHPEASAGPLSVNVGADEKQVAPGYAVQLTGLVEGKPLASVWDFGDQVTVTNQPYPSHTWRASGDYVVTLSAYNGSNSQGVQARLIVHVVDGVLYVDGNSSNPTPPYASWATAATNIQDAVDAVVGKGVLVLVTNGTYRSGWRDLNLVSITNVLTLRSVNGPRATIIDAHGSGRCLYLAAPAIVSGFTLTNGAANQGGGVFCEPALGAVLTNCLLRANAAEDGGGAYGGILNACALIENYSGQGSGGGANRSTLNNCVVSANYGAQYGGGAAYGALSNCTVSGNSATLQGGGVYSGTLNNSIAYFNEASLGSNYWTSVLNYSCSSPLFEPLGNGGFGNITNAPLFVNPSAGDFHLQSTSPCINAGWNGFTPGGADFDGQTRIVAGTVDMGAFEFPSPGSQISYAWLQQFGLPTDGSVDDADSDGDGLTNFQEWHCGTDPTNALSALRLWVPLVTTTNVVVTWPTVSGRSYVLERSSSASSVFLPLGSTVAAWPNTTTLSWYDTNAPGPFFYRVRVEDVLPVFYFDDF